MKPVHLLLFTLILFGCGKEHSNKWLLADVTLLDYHTHEPIVSQVKMKYYETGLGQATEEEEDLGSSNNDGNFKLERRIYRDEKAFELQFFGPGKYSNNNPVFTYPSYTLELKNKSKNQAIIYLKQYRKYTIHLTNTNCTGIQDSVWLEIPGPTFGSELYTGCQDSTYSSSVYGCYGKYQEEGISITVRAKKNGVTTITNQSFPLQIGIVNLISINY